MIDLSMTRRGQSMNDSISAFGDISPAQRDCVHFIADLAARAASANAPAEGDYIDEEGFLRCGSCHGRKQTIVAPFGVEVKVSCSCPCASAAFDAEQEQRRQRAEAERVSRLRASGLGDEKNRRACFDRAEMNDKLRLCQRYADRWEEMLKKNHGLLLWGDTGTGKTYAASCIANALIDRSVPVLQTSFSRIIADVQANNSLNSFLRDLDSYPLVILDDYGVERQTAYTQEIMFAIVDRRYSSRKPLIITTNLGLSDFKSPSDKALKRLNERILEMCVPIEFNARNYRRRAAEEKLQEFKRLMN